jgi:hydrogenase nickel incorporation protein HypA/HybF
VFGVRAWQESRGVHETSVAQRMVDMAVDVSDKNGGGRVVGMRLLLGDMTSLDAETLSFAFDVVSRGTRVQGCALQIVRVPNRLRCRGCGAERGGDLLDPCAPVDCPGARSWPAARCAWTPST